MAKVEENYCSSQPNSGSEEVRSARRPHIVNSKMGLKRGIILAAIFSSSWNVFALALPLYSMQIFDRVLPSGSLATLAVLSGIAVVFIFCSVLLDGSRAAIFARLSHRLDLALYMSAAKGALAPDPRGAEALRDLETCRLFLSGPLAGAVLDAPWFGVFVAAIFFIHPVLGWLTVSAAVVVVAVAVSGNFITDRGRMRVLRFTREGHAILETARVNHVVVSAMGLETGILERLYTLRECGLGMLGKVNERQAWVDALGRGLRCAVQVTVLSTAAILVINRDTQVGSIVATSMLFSRAIAPIERLVAGLHVLLGTYEAWRRSVAALCKRSIAPTTLKLPALEGHLATEQLCFSVLGRAQPIVNQVSLSVSAGEVLVVVGPEAAGKSTFAQLLIGALQPTSGVVRLDGSNIADLDRSNLGPQVGFLPEDVTLETGLVADVIARGTERDDAAVVAAARLAGAHSMIQRLPSGYQTIVGPGYLSLSAGQRQRIGLARALYRYPKFVVLDEPTAHLDDAGEAIVLQAIMELKRRSSTVVVVSRQPGLVHLADSLVMLENGHLVLKQNAAGLHQLLRPRLASSNEGD